MPYQVKEFHDTPNPNAIKCVLDRALPDNPPRQGSYRSIESTAANDLALALMSIPGVVGVLIHSDWLTVSKDPGTPWKPIKGGVSRVLGSIA